MTTNALNSSLEFTGEKQESRLLNVDFLKKLTKKRFNQLFGYLEEKDIINFGNEIIETPKPQEIDEILSKIKLGVILSKNDRLKLLKKISLNNPYINFFANTKRGDYAQIMIFSGIKELNDQTSQSFTDSVLINFKKRFSAYYPNCQILWDDYKNFVVKSDKNQIINENELNKMLLSEYRLLIMNSEYNGKIKINKFSIKTKKFRLSGKNQKELLHNLGHERLKLERTSLGSNILSKEEIGVFEQEFYNSYNFSHGEKRSYYEVPNSKEKFYIIDNILYHEFEHKGRIKTEINIIFTSHNKLSIEIITKLRKGFLPLEMPFVKEGKQLIDSYIGRGEFITPFSIYGENTDGEIVDSKLLNNYKYISTSLRTGIIDREDYKLFENFAENTYKNSLDKQTFYSKINTNGTLVYIDVKDMGSLNVRDFSDKIRAYNNGQIKSEEILDKSGEYMTYRFYSIFDSIKSECKVICPENEINFYVGGDEIMFFIKGDENNNSKLHKLIKKIFLKFDNLNIDGRIMYKNVIKDKIITGEDEVKMLDLLTKKAKAIEKRIDFIKQDLLIESSKNRNNGPILYLIQEKQANLEKIKDFTLSIESGVEMITFNNNPFKDFDSKMELNKIIDDDLFLLGYPPSPFTKFLDEHGFGRKYDR